MRKPQVSDRVIQSMAKVMVRDGIWIERSETGAVVATWKIRRQRGRPAPGEIGLVAALCRRLAILRQPLSRQVVHRALAGTSRRSHRPPPISHHDHLADQAPSPTPRPPGEVAATVDRDLRSVGLTPQDPAPMSSSPPSAALTPTDALLALEEALDWALSVQACSGDLAFEAQHLLDQLRQTPTTVG